jgi:hypothetical protein
MSLRGKIVSVNFSVGSWQTGAAEFPICEWRLRTEERKIRAIGVICGF